MKKLFFILAVVSAFFAILAVVSAFFSMSCTANGIAAINMQREADTAKYQSEYARTVNKLEMVESNFHWNPNNWIPVFDTQL